MFVSWWGGEGIGGACLPTSAEPANSPPHQLTNSPIHPHTSRKNRNNIFKDHPLPMDSHTLSTLEFDAVREQVRRYVSCSLGAEEVDRMAPETEIRRIRGLHQEVSEARQ